MRYERRSISHDRQINPLQSWSLKTYFTASLAFTPLNAVRNPVLVVEDGRIEHLGSRESVVIPAGAKHVDFADRILAPGYIDIHIHGGAGHDVMEGDEAALRAIETKAV